MNLQDFEPYNKKEHKYVITKEFNTRMEPTKRMIQVSEAFGLGISEAKQFTIYKDFHIGFNRGDVVFVTGDSGGGKSLLLKEIREQLITEDQKNAYNIVEIEDIKPDPEEVIIESIGSTLEEAVYYLSMMGLNDAFIFLRKYKELSDGQKYRYKLAVAIYKLVDYIFIDEFCANLDRTTAKVIAYNMQRVCRKRNITLFAATTHRDIIEDLNPDVLVDKKFMDEVEINYYDTTKKQISFYDDVTLEEGTIEDYKKLAKYHYKNTSTNFPYMKVVKATYDNDLVGVAVFSPPFLQTKGRTIKFNKKYSMMKTEVVKEINKLFIRGSRYVISPKYRACGLGKKLAIESLPHIKEKKYLEVVTVMGKYNPIFEKIGMEKIEITSETDSAAIKLDKWLKEKIKIEEVHNPIMFRKFVKELAIPQKKELRLLVGKVLHHPKIGLSGKEGKRAEVVAQEKRYKESSFEDVHEEILVYVPKLYSGTTIYYVLENPFYTENKTL